MSLCADVAIAFGLMDHVDPDLAYRLYGAALNKRLGTANLTVVEMLAVLNGRNLTFGDLMSIVENDDWVYDFATGQRGPAMVCSAFAMSLYRAAGLFPETEFQAAEFAPKDSYQIEIFDSAWQPPAECGAAPGEPWCQVNGWYRMELPDFNTLTMYTGMNEKCGAVPPSYERTPKYC